MPLLRMDGRSNAGPSALPEVAGGRGSLLVPGVRDPGAEQSGGPQGAVSKVRAPQLQRAPRAQGEGVSPGAAGKVLPGTAACDVIFAPLAAGEGVRVGLVGDTGCGKSYAARMFAAEYLRRSRGLLAVANSKGDAGWVGEVRASVGALAGEPPRGRQIVFVPDLARGDLLDLESVARWQWALAGRRVSSCVIYDELSDACDDGEWFKGTQMLPRAFTHGRSKGVSLIWGAQFAQLVPRQPWECSSVICCWRQYGNALAILRRRGYTDDAAERVIAALPGDDVPPSRRGHFVLLRRGRPWDGRVYRF